MVAVVFESEAVVGLAEVMDVVGTPEVAEVLDVVGDPKPVDEAELVEGRELVEERELVEVLDVEVTVREVTGGNFLNGLALSELLESFARTTSWAGHSVSQASEEQHPRKGLSKSKHVYQSPSESSHSCSVMFAPFSFLKLVYRTSLSGQYCGHQNQR